MTESPEEYTVSEPFADTDTDPTSAIEVLPKQIPPLLEIIANPDIAEHHKRFLIAYSECGLKTEATRRTGVGFIGFNKYCRAHPEMYEYVKLADQAYNERLVGEVRRRAVEGVDEPVYQGGKLVGHITRYSDQLLMFLVKSRLPEFRDRYDFSVAVNDQMQKTADKYGISKEELEAEVEKIAGEMMEAS